ncbi:MAG: PD40 domain-containing protein [Planctomycetes bacterium]|nr:PD40 domain-containing protein [Planctomycetota bacterium]MCW8136613.1 PD40 domain-containing protein [Planctomycetota bacterium]
MNKVSALAALLAAVAVVSYSPTIAQDAPREAPALTNARMLRFPDVSATHICFVYAGDIWTVPKAGGGATRLSTAPGEEYKPRFSPDGRSIAFSANYDGNMDIYTLPVEGGYATRLTHHPAADLMVDWTPDGKSIIYSTSATSPTGRYAELYKLSAKGGLPEKLAVPYGDNASMSPDGGSVAFNPWSVDFRTWKRYRGGMASRMWTFNLKTHEAVEISNTGANFGNPMWHGDRIFYLCDEGEAARNNIWVYDVKTAKRSQVTFYKDFDVRFPAIGPEDIVFEHGGRLHLLDLKTTKPRPVDVSVVTDGATLRPRLASASGSVANSGVSPLGERAVFEARGDIFTVPAEHGVTRNLTRTPGIFERYPSWSPDGKLIAYWSDRGGEYELTTQPAEGGPETTHTKLGPGYRYVPQWSPDSRRVAFIDQTMRIRLHDFETGKTHEVDKGLWTYHGALERFRVSFSTDSRWMAYSRGQDNSNDAIYIYDTTTHQSRKVTSAYYNDESPAFDPAGNYLYFVSGRSFNPIYSDIDNTWIYTNTQVLMAVPLRRDVKSPLATRNNDESSPRPEPRREARDDSKPKPPVGIDFEDFERRGIELPAQTGRISNVQAVEGRVLYLRRPRTGSADRNSSLVSYDLESREERVIDENVGNFEVAAGGRRMLVESRGSFSIRAIQGGSGARGGRGAGEGEPDPARRDRMALSLADMQCTVDPGAEWRQMFIESWRLQRDFFYDRSMHGVDWPKVREQYGALLGQCVTRWDLNYLISEMISELNASHTYNRGGEAESGPSVNVGMLGCDYALEQGRYRIVKIYDGAPWDSEVRSPLNESSLGIKQGMWLLAVNGVEIDTSRDPWAAFQGLAGKVVALTINDKPSVDGARVVHVTAMDSESRLRYLSDVEATRAKVETASGGRIGYVYVPDTGRRGQTELVRQLRAQFKCEAMIIDERFNGGGQLPDRFVELLDRPALCYWGVRDGADWQTPMFAHQGPKAMLINGRAGSGGDAFPYFFKRAGCGKLIGTRTWGGLIGITGAPRLLDGGSVTVPTFGIYNTEGEWIIEGYGVDPDIEVVAHPTKLAKGEDPEVDRAVKELLDELKTNAPKPPAKPKYPDRSGK